MPRRPISPSEKADRAAGHANYSRPVDDGAQRPADSLFRRAIAAPSLAAVVIALATLLTYAGSLHGVFVLDDDIWIVNNAYVHQLAPLGEVLFPPAPTVAGRPLLSLTLAANYALGGLDVVGYHVFNIAVHLLAALVLFGLVRRTLLSPSCGEWLRGAATWLALAVALLWAVHPLQTAAVTYVVQRGEALAGLFYLLTLYCAVRGATVEESGPRAGLWRAIWYAAAVASCILGMATKEILVTAPLVLLLYDRAFLAGSFAGAIRQRWGLYLALVATWGIAAWSVLSTGYHAGTTGAGVKQFTAWSYLITQPGVICHYLLVALWPDKNRLNLDYGWPVAEHTDEIVGPGLVILALLAATVWLLIRRPRLGFVAAAFFLILAPTSSFVPLSDAAFDHRMYLPLAAVIVIVVLAVVSGLRRLIGAFDIQPPGSGVWVAAGLVLLGCVAALSVETAERNDDFRSRLELLADCARKSPDNARARANLADALAQNRRLKDAIAQGEEAVRLDPSAAEARINLCNYLLNAGQPAAAVAQGAEAIKLKPDNAKFRVNYAWALAQNGDLKGAIAECEEAIRLDRQLTEAHMNLAAFLAMDKQLDRALEEGLAAVKLSPNSAPVHYNLSGIYFQQGRLDKALVESRRAVELDPSSANSQVNLARLLIQSGKPREAVAPLRVAMALQPNDPSPRTQLAWLLATSPDPAVRDGQQALELAQQAVKLTGGRDINAIDALAAALAEVGNFDQATALAKQALQGAKAAYNAAMAESMEGRLRFYRVNKPYRDEPPAAVDGGNSSTP